MEKESNNETSSVKAKSITIFDYINTTEKFIIPRYQREYSWEKTNISAIINDLKQDYYIGNVIIYKNNLTNEKEIVDGQQRLITIFLLLIAIMQLTTNDEIRNSIMNLIKNEKNETKLNLKPRIGTDGSEIINFIIEEKPVLKDLEDKYKEITMYKYIKEQIKTKDLDALYYNIINSNLVEIIFENHETSAHEMFVNVNTKGKPLELIEILKSQLFKELLIDGVDYYKEMWQNMLEEIPFSEYNNYCSDVYLLDYFKNNKSLKKFNTSKSVPDNAKELITSIDSKERAQSIFDFMTNNNIDCLFKVYSAFKKHEISSLKNNNYYSSRMNSISFTVVDAIWKLYGEIRFKQSDILFISLFYNKENFIISEINYVIILMKFILMYEISRSILNISPANYSNSFKQVSALICNTNNIHELKLIIRDFIKDMKLSKEQRKILDEKMKNENTFLGTKSRIAKFVIIMAEEVFESGLTIEHFIPQKTTIESDKVLIGKLGNLIPVRNDKYKNKSVIDKINLYAIDMLTNKCLENFMNYNITGDNYSEIIENRSVNLTNKFLEKMDIYYDGLMNG